MKVYKFVKAQWQTYYYRYTLDTGQYWSANFVYYFFKAEPRESPSVSLLLNPKGDSITNPHVLHRVAPAFGTVASLV